MVKIDAPAAIIFQYKAPHRYGQLDIEHTPKMRIYSDYYADDDRIEVNPGEKGMLFINRYTARTVDLPRINDVQGMVNDPHTRKGGGMA